MDRPDSTLAALKANLYRPLQHWYRNNRTHVWLYCAIYYGLQLGHGAFYLYLRYSIVSSQPGGLGGLTVTQLTAASIGYSVVYYLMVYVAVLALVKAPAMMVSQPEVELAYPRLDFLRCFIGVRWRVASRLAAGLLLPPLALGAVVQLATRGWSWPWGPLLLTNTGVNMAYWLLIAALAVAISFLNLNHALQSTAAVAAILGHLVVWMAAFKLGILMTATAGPLDQLLVSIFQAAIWVFIFWMAFYFLHRRLIPRLAADYLSS